jgi:hypothetical protein
MSMFKLRSYHFQLNTGIAVASIKFIHVYDFDNTLFSTPLPNKLLWNSQTIGALGSPDIFTNGGWWHDPTILACTGEGVEKEEPRAWEGWWSEKIVDLVRLTMESKEALCVLLTGRDETKFGGLIKQMIAAKKLSFDMICLKPQVGPWNGQRFPTTMSFKQELLKDIIYTYKDAERIDIYEDRAKQWVTASVGCIQCYNKIANLLCQHSRIPRIFIQFEQNVNDARCAYSSQNHRLRGTPSSRVGHNARPCY